MTYTIQLVLEYNKGGGGNIIKEVEANKEGFLPGST
jgi:hypothetical protein